MVSNMVGCICMDAFVWMHLYGCVCMDAFDVQCNVFLLYMYEKSMFRSNEVYYQISHIILHFT